VGEFARQGRQRATKRKEEKTDNNHNNNTISANNTLDLQDPGESKTRDLWQAIN